MFQIVAVSAGLSVPSSTRNLAEQLAGATQTAINTRGESATVTYIDLRELAEDLAHAFTTPGLVSEALTQAVDTLTKSDAIIAVTPIYKASYSGLFKMFFDVVDAQALVDKPALIAATAGSPRHSLALEHAVRPLFSFLRARTVPTAVFAATEDFGSEAGDALSQRIGRAATELATSLIADSSTVGGLGGAFARGSEEEGNGDNNFADQLRKYQ